MQAGGSGATEQKVAKVEGAAREGKRIAEWIDSVELLHKVSRARASSIRVSGSQDFSCDQG